MLKYPEEWKVCPQCKGHCLGYIRGLVGIGGTFVMRVSMKCESCKAISTYDDPKLATYDAA